MASILQAVKTRAGRIAARCGCRRFIRNADGVTAVEFSLVGIPFVLLMSAIFETGLMFLAGQTMENAVSNAARLIRTGQAQQQGITADAFKNLVCNQIIAMFKCTSNLYIDVQKYTTFDSMNLGVPRDAEGNLLKTGYQYVPGSGGEIVVVRSFYEWPTFLTKFALSNQPNGKHLLASYVAFKNEPFPW